MAPEVGVLLPVRLETRFVPPDGPGGSWRLLVRIVPDAVSLGRHHADPSTVELDALDALWAATGGDLGTDDGERAWRRFVPAVGGPGRAAWLVRTFPPGSARPDVVREPLVTSRLVGLPEVLELWLGRGGNPPVVVASLPVDPDRLTLDLPDPATGETRWWSSFEEAKLAGLGTVVDLGPQTPDDLDVLLVLGLGDGDPAEVFAAHRDAGILGVLPVGVPTNSVAGEPAADLAGDPETWRRLLVAPGPQLGAYEVSLALTGTPDTLRPLPGGDAYDVGLARDVVGALWHSVFGHGLKDAWQLAGFPGGTHDLGLWAAQNLLPEGPVPSVRVGDQPYGVLPATSLARWKPDAFDPAVEEGLLTVLPGLRSVAARAADGTTEGADTDRLLDLIGRVPVSRGYAWRWNLPLDVARWWWAGYSNPVPPGAAEAWWDDRARALLDLGAEPARRRIDLGWPQDLQLPLVEPDNVVESFAECVRAVLRFPPRALASEKLRGKLFPVWPDSLLLRLLVHSIVVGDAEVVRGRLGLTGAVLEPLATAPATRTLLQQHAMEYDDGMLDGEPHSKLLGLSREAAERLADADVTVLERVFRGVLDTASHRVDPWITGLAWRRLQHLTSQGARFRTGVFGWVDAPRPRGDGGFAAEFLHAPSPGQAMTSAVLRDRALYDADDARWRVDVDSDGVRAAAGLAEEVRAGAHLSEALGRAVERVVAVRADVERLRREFPVRTEHEGRRVCDGLAVVARFRVDPGSLGVDAGRLAGIAALAEAVDSYGDLLLADAVFDVVSGRTALAAQSMEAAAGLAVPPALDVLRTPRSGQTVSSTVVVALPDVAAPAVVDESTSPGLLADPAVAAHLQEVSGDPAGPVWTWSLVDPAGNPVGTATLADLGLLPVDTLGSSAADLLVAVVEFLGLDSTSTGPVPAGLAVCDRTARTLGSRPVVPADLVEDSSEPSDAAVGADLLARYSAVHGVGTALQAALVTAAGLPVGEQRARLRDALRWHVTPSRADDPTPGVLLTRAATSLGERLSRAPSPAEAAASSPAALARSLAELVSPESGVPVLSRLPLDAVPVVPGEPLDPDWLSVVAAVRTPVARLEAELLRHPDGTTTSWSNRPGDPWQVDLGVDPAEQGLRPSTRLVAAFGPVGTLDAAPGGTVALGLVDSWSEVVPGTDQTTHVAFHYDAPAARAPQAVLVAVPPVVGEALDTATLLDVVLETRELARARVAPPSVLAEFSAGAPTTTFPVADPGVSLDGTS